VIIEIIFEYLISNIILKKKLEDKKDKIINDNQKKLQILEKNQENFLKVSLTEKVI
jgi:hypothetical protein